MMSSSVTLATAESAAADHVVAMFTSIMAGDMVAFQRCFVPGAVLWHAHDEVEQDVPAAAAVLGFLCASSSCVEYLDQRIVAVGNLRFIQHVLSADLKQGTRLRLPAMMRVEVAEDGRVARVEEYFDSRATDCLFKPQLDMGAA